MNFQLAEMQRRLANMVTIGKVVELDEANKKLRVQVSETIDGQLHVTGWLPWPAEIGRNFVRWRPVRLHTQVVLVAACGDLNQAQVVGMLYSNAILPEVDGTAVDRIEFGNGAVVEHNNETHTMMIDCKGDLSITCSGVLKLDANSVELNATKHSITGPVTQTGGDMTSDGLSVQKHIHSGVTVGNGITAEPMNAPAK